MPTVTFTVETDSVDVRLSVRKSGQVDPVTLNHGTGQKQYPSGYVATAVLFFRGPVGTKAKIKITQIVNGTTETLAERNFIEITEPTGAATADLGFVVR